MVEHDGAGGSDVGHDSNNDTSSGALHRSCSHRHDHGHDPSTAASSAPSTAPAAAPQKACCSSHSHNHTNTHHSHVLPSPAQVSRFRVEVRTVARTVVTMRRRPQQRMRPQPTYSNAPPACRDGKYGSKTHFSGEICFLFCVCLFLPSGDDADGLKRGSIFILGGGVRVSSSNERERSFCFWDTFVFGAVLRFFGGFFVV